MPPGDTTRGGRAARMARLLGEADTAGNGRARSAVRHTGLVPSSAGDAARTRSHSPEPGTPRVRAGSPRARQNYAGNEAGSPWNENIPRYRQLAADLISAVETGELRVGDELPSEYELCERYGVSRTTVREAFRLVELEGLISRQQGAVRKVIAKQLRGYTMSLGSEEETRRYAAENIVDYRPDKQLMSAKKAADLGIPDPEMYRSATGLHWERAEGHPAGAAPGHIQTRLPIALTTVYIRHPYSEIVDSLHGPSSIVLFAPICASYGLALSHVDQVTTAILIPPAVARRLSCEPNALGLRVIHRFYADNIGLFELTDEIYPADRFNLFHRFSVVSSAKGTGRRR